MRWKTDRNAISGILQIGSQRFFGDCEKECEGISRRLRNDHKAIAHDSEATAQRYSLQWERSCEATLRVFKTMVPPSQIDCSAKAKRLHADLHSEYSDIKPTAYRSISFCNAMEKRLEIDF
jgi:hypothetical protein